MDEQKEKQQWHGRISAEISDASAEQVWKEARSFSGLERWHPSLEECEIVEGEDGSIGCVRVCKNGDLWVKEMLLAFDDANMSYTYSVIDGNIGLDSFVVSFTVLPATATAVSSSSSACTVVWEFRVDPPPNTSYEEFLGFLKSVIETWPRVCNFSPGPSLLLLRAPFMLSMAPSFCEVGLALFVQ